MTMLMTIIMPTVMAIIMGTIMRIIMNTRTLMIIITTTTAKTMITGMKLQPGATLMHPNRRS
jgi:hypothetical protein